MVDSLIIQAALLQIQQTTLLVIQVAALIFVINALVLLVYVIRGADEPLEYGNFFVWALGIMAVLIVSLVAFPLILSGVTGIFPKPWLASLSGLIATTMVLLANYRFKVRSDESQGADLKRSMGFFRMGFFLEHFAVFLSLLYGLFTVIGILYRPAHKPCEAWLSLR